MSKTEKITAPARLSLNADLRRGVGRQRQKQHDDLTRADIARSRNDLSPIQKIEEKRIEDLQPYQKHTRKIEPDQVRRVADSIRTFGMIGHVIINPHNVIIAGHVIVEACKALGLKTVRCAVVDHLSSAEERALRISLNALAERGTWDVDALYPELSELTVELESNLAVLGLESEVVDLLLDGPDTAAEKEDAEIVPGAQPAVSRAGDIWAVAGHRILCGDGLALENHQELFAEQRRARVVIADPPYNCPIDGFAGGKGEIHHRDFAMAVGEMSDEEFEAFLAMLLERSRQYLVPGGLQFIFMDWRNIEVLLRAGRNLELKLLNLVVWNKQRGGMGGLYRNAHELVAVFKVGPEPHLDRVKLGKHGRDRTNIWSYAGATTRGSSAHKQLAHHPTPKSVELLKDALLDTTARGEIVFDPMAGSGSTLIAAQKTGRIGYGIEIDPLYVDTIVRRLEKACGAEAIDLRTGATFAAREVRVAEISGADDGRS